MSKEHCDYTNEVLCHARRILQEEHPIQDQILEPSIFLRLLERVASQYCLDSHRMFQPILPVIGRAAAKYPDLAIRQWSGTVREAGLVLDQVITQRELASLRGELAPYKRSW